MSFRCRWSVRAALTVPFAAGLFVGLVVSIAPPASASCMLPPLKSPHAFIGSVVKVASDGKIATVRTAGGSTVTIIGGPGAASGRPVATSVDRQYVEGKTYEFHPLNGESPYRDNACTATHQVASGHGAASPKIGQGGVTTTPTHGTGAPHSTSADSSGNSSVVLLVGVVGVPALGALALFVAGRRRRASSGK
jgi:hypothetical protein